MVRSGHGPVATLRNIQETPTAERAAVQGLTSYDGDVVVPPSQPKAIGRQVNCPIFLFWRAYFDGLSV